MRKEGPNMRATRCRRSQQVIGRNSLSMNILTLPIYMSIYIRLRACVRVCVRTCVRETVCASVVVCVCARMHACVCAFWLALLSGAASCVRGPNAAP